MSDSSGPASTARLRELCHELSQPLTVARCSLELALGMPEGDAGRNSFLQDALQAMERMVTVAAAIRDAVESGPNPNA